MHRVQVESESGVDVVSARGELDAYAAPDLESCLGRCTDGGAVVIDLGEVSFLDSTALGVIARAVRKIGEAGGDARVVLPRTTARRIFELTTLDRALALADSREAALADLERAL